MTHQRGTTFVTSIVFDVTATGWPSTTRACLVIGQSITRASRIRFARVMHTSDQPLDSQSRSGLKPERLKLSYVVDANEKSDLEKL